MADIELTLQSSRLLPGCAFGLAEPTALVEVTCRGVDAFDAEAEARVRDRAAAFYPDENYYLFFGVSEQDWPGAFLLPGGADPDGAHRLGRWVVALTIILQRWAYDLGFRGSVVHADAERLLLAVPWRREELFSGALELAIRLLGLWAQPEPPAADLEEATAYFRDGLDGLHSRGLIVDGLRFAQAAVARDIPVSAFFDILRLGWGANTEYLHATFTQRTGWLAHYVAKNKNATSSLLAQAGVPVPPMRVVAEAAAAEQAAAELGWPVVVKPASEDMSKGVVAGITTVERLRTAFDAAAAMSPGRVMIEKHLPGDSHRLLVVHGRVLDTVRRVPPEVTGDGEHSIAELIERANTDPRRRTILKPVKLDDEGVEFLREQGLHRESVPERGRVVRFAHLTFRRVGGYTEDVSTLVHPDNRALAERAARILQLDIAGVDLLIEDIGRSWRDVGGAVLEVNSQPSLMPHWLARPEWDVNGEILDLLTGGRSLRIPTAVISGVEGAGRAAALLQRIWQTAGVLTGICTRDGVTIGEEVVSTADLCGQPGIQMILTDPTVHAGVFELPAEKLIEFGHGCDRYDVVAVTNSSPDNQELHADMLRRAHRAIVLNAEDPCCMAIRFAASAPRHILVATNPEVVASHRAVGGDAVYLEVADGRSWMTLSEGETTTRLGSVEDTGGETTAMLVAAALAWAQGIDPAVIAEVLT